MRGPVTLAVMVWSAGALAQTLTPTTPASAASADAQLQLRVANQLASMFPKPTGPAFVLPSELQLKPNALAASEALPSTTAFDQLYLKERYPQAAALGLELVQAGVALTQEQRFRLANALSWSGQPELALPYYRGLFFTPFDAAARLGLANAERWRGRQELAAPVYQQVLALAPDNSDARMGLSLATRQLRPSTVLSVGRALDNQGLTFDQLNATHTWRNDTGLRILTVDARGVQSTADAVPGLVPYQTAQNKALGVRYEALDLRFAPRLHVELQTAPDTQIFGGVRLKLGEGATYASLARVGWGALNYSARAMAARYSATQWGLAHATNTSWGAWSLDAQAFQVSDGNSVLTSQLKFTPAWRPFGPGFKTFVVTDTRHASFNTPDYWSPAGGYGTASVGVSQAWEQADWTLYTSAQVGNKLLGEAGPSWSASVGGKRWLSPDYALGLNATTLSNRRDDAAYRASFVNLNVEKLW